MAGNGKNPEISRRTRALGVLLAVLRARITRLSVTNLESKLGWGGTTKMDRFKKGVLPLTEDEEHKFTVSLRGIIIDAATSGRYPGLLDDIGMLRSTVTGYLEEDLVKYFNCVNRVDLDSDLMKEFGASSDVETNRRLLKRTNGFWFVIRYSTEDDSVQPDGALLNVSLLTIKDPSYMRRGPDGTPRRMIMGCPHFKLQSVAYEERSPWGQGRVYRGPVIQTKPEADIINFIGSDHDHLPPMFQMSLTFDETTKHANEAHGVIVTANNADQIAGPVVACYVPHDLDAIRLREDLGEAGSAQSVPLADRYTRRADELMTHVGRFKPGDFIERINASYQLTHLPKAIERLKKARAAAKRGARAGYYSVLSPGD